MLNIAPNVTFNKSVEKKMCCSGNNMIPKLSVLDAVIDNILKALNSEVTLFLTADMQLTLHLMAVVMVTGQCQTFFIHQTACFSSCIVLQCHIFGCEGVLDFTHPTTQTTDQSVKGDCDMGPLNISVCHIILHCYPQFLVAHIFCLPHFAGISVTETAG